MMLVAMAPVCMYPIQEGNMTLLSLQNVWMMHRGAEAKWDHVKSGAISVPPHPTPMLPNHTPSAPSRLWPHAENGSLIAGSRERRLGQAAASHMRSDIRVRGGWAGSEPPPHPPDVMWQWLSCGCKTSSKPVHNKCHKQREMGGKGCCLKGLRGPSILICYSGIFLLLLLQLGVVEGCWLLFFCKRLA